MARTGFGSGYFPDHIDLPYFGKSPLLFFKSCQGVLLLAFKNFKRVPHPLPGVLLLSGWTSGTSRFTKASHTNYEVPACEVHFENRKLQSGRH